MIVAGLISGTSMDGLDVAVADVGFDGDDVTLRILHTGAVDWEPALRERLLAVLPPATTTAEELTWLDQAVGQACAEAVAALEHPVELVASHGQTVFHAVDADGRARGGLQLGQPAWIVERTGLPVVSDLRSRDIAAGGQGAPLASTLDALWLRDGAALNLGGIANVTIVDGGRVVAAFDTGPANCLIDVAATRITGGAQHADVDGALAAAGTVDARLLDALLQDPYYALPAPKSTGRERFDTTYVDAADIDPNDLLATLTELTARTVADALAPYAPRQTVASGGGTRNPTLMRRLAHHLAAPIVTAEAQGLPADGKEAVLLALLGAFTWHGVPGVAPGATGSATPRVLGRISPGDAPLRLPEPRTPPTRLHLLS